MDNMNEDFEKYYNQQQHQHQNQNQPIGQEHISTNNTNHQQAQIIQPNINLVNSQHRHSIHDTFDQQSLLNLVPNDFYSTSQFNNNNVNSNPNIIMNSQYKPYTDNQSIFLDQINRGTIPPHQTDRSKSLSYMPSNQPYQDNLNLNQLQQHRRNSDMVFYHDNNTTNENNYMFSMQQQGLINEPFEQSQNLNSTQPKPRQEQDVFGELISMATKNNVMNQPWQNNNNNNNTSIQYIPPSFSSSHIQRQIQSQHQQQNKKNQYHINTTNPLHSNQIAVAAAAATLAASSKAHKKSISTSKNTETITTNYDERIYELSIAQQPSRARMCGFGDKDRRPISPPPIVQLVVTTKSGQVINPETFDTSFLIVMCDSCQQTDPIDGDFNASMFENPLSQVISYPTTTNDDDETNPNTAIKMRNLVGSSVSSATKLYDLDGKLGIFFVFQDVSLRTEGCFRLKFSLVDVGMPYSHNVNTTSVSHVLKVIYTDPFIVYTAKKFPGVVQSTLLSKCFARQGIKIPIRKEKNSTLKKNQANQASEVAEHSEDEDCQDDKA